MSVKKWIYKHYKNKLYEVIDVATHTETQEELVIYKVLYDIPWKNKNDLWVRPMNMFFETLLIDGLEKPRFEYIWNKKHGVL